MTPSRPHRTRRRLTPRPCHGAAWCRRLAHGQPPLAGRARRHRHPKPLHSRVVDLRGDVLRNGTRLHAQDRIAAGDQLETGPGSRVVLTVGDSAFLVRENTRLALEGDSPVTVRLLRLLSGAVASVWSRGQTARSSPHHDGGHPGTGVYAEVLPSRTFAAISATATAPWTLRRAATAG